MSETKRYGLKSILLTSFWMLIGCGVLVLLVAGVKKKDQQHCKGVEIEIEGVDNNYFVDKADVANAISMIAKGNPVGKVVGNMNLRSMERELMKNVWVRSAQLYFDNNEILQVIVHEREPIARVFGILGNSFYTDRDNAMLPLSDKFAARLPVFTGFPSDAIVLSKADSSLLKDIGVLSLAIQKDPFLMAMIDQVDITADRTFEMVPKMGNQVIVFGDASKVDEKFNSLKLFYNKVMSKVGWNYYSTINLQFKGQIVAKKRGAEDISADSLRTTQAMQLIAANAEKLASDSLQTIMQDSDKNTVDTSMIQHSIQREEN
jgi:cell division protein FtsQ